jgi:ABC-2 type transport system permease protein
MKANKNKRLFSKALFKQSCKANGVMWAIITTAVCFMLSCVMLISGTSNISAVKDGIQDTIIQELITSEIKKTSVNLCDSTLKGEKEFDNNFVAKFNELNTKENADEFNAYKNQKTQEAYLEGATLVTNKVTEKVTADVTQRVLEEQNQIQQEVTQAVTEDMNSSEAQSQIAALMGEGKTQVEAIEIVKAKYILEETEKIKNNHINAAKQDILLNKKDQYTLEAKEELQDELDLLNTTTTEDITNKFKEMYVIPSYEYAANSIKNIYSEDTSEYKVTMLTINPNHVADEEYTKNSEVIPSEYVEDFSYYMLSDVSSWEDGVQGYTLNDYIDNYREDFILSRATNSCSMVVGAKLTDASYKQEILDILKDYKVDEETYDAMGFDYSNVHKIAYESIEEFQNKYTYEVSLISDEVKENNEAYKQEKERIYDKLYVDVAGSLLDKLPENVSSGIHELGTMDLYGLIVGSIFFKMAGLLLPIIYVIMCSNSLIAGQVDTGSMAYVLSTSTRRKEVTFTQAVYLIGSLFLMFALTTITSCVCFAIANVTTDLTYGKIILINLGAFVTLFAISGINYLTSCYFDRSKKAMALGGGISMFFLVATMLGLFGSPVIPSVVRISALNNFNYVSLISLFDVVSILNCGTEWIYKLLILIAIGLVGYIVGSIKFQKKDLPL